MTVSAAGTEGRTLASWAGSLPAAPGDPAWLAAFRRSGVRGSEGALCFPLPGDDAWRHMGLDALMAPEWRPLTGGCRVEGVDAALEGLNLETWAAMNALPSAVRARASASAFVSLNAALCDRALNIHAGGRFCSLQPLRVSPVAESAGPAAADGWMLNPRLSVTLEPGSRLDLVIDLGGLPVSAGLLNLVADIELKEQTALNLVFAGTGASRALTLTDLSVAQSRDSVFRVFALETHSRQSRLEIGVDLNGENATADLFGLALLGGEARAFQHLNVRHRVPRTQSQQIFKSVLAGSARFEYDSLVTIASDAPHSSSEQLNKNLVLSDAARAYARPQLAIHTDEVQCHHGATVGQMNAEELFYLRTRGLDPAEAAALVLRGFVDDLLKEIPVPGAAAQLQKRARARLEEIAR